ncbi:MAG: hypothetical protein ACO1OB_04280, partial [Archangium sp.]
MSERSTSVALLAAVLSLGAVPLGAVIFGLTANPAEGWLEGGAWMYGLLLLAMLASVVNAAGVFFAARGAPFVLGGGLFASVVTALASALTLRSALG